MIEIKRMDAGMYILKDGRTVTKEELKTLMMSAPKKEPVRDPIKIKKKKKKKKKRG